MSVRGRIRPVLAAGLLPAVAVLAFASCEGEKAPPDPEEVAAHMRDHFNRASDLQRAVVNGDRDGIEKAAKWLASHSKMSGAPAS